MTTVSSAAPPHRFRRKKTEQPRPPSPDDLWLNELKTRCARAAIEWLKESVNIQRPINTLKRAELEALAGCITNEWIVAVSEKIATERDKVPEEYVRLLGI